MAADCSQKPKPGALCTSTAWHRGGSKIENDKRKPAVEDGLCRHQGLFQMCRSHPEQSLETDPVAVRLLRVEVVSEVDEDRRVS